MLIAHKHDDRFQSVEEHCQNTARYCSALGEKMGLGSTCHLLGLVHDIGKASSAFQDYINQNKGSFKRGDIDHSVVGMQLLHKKFIETKHGISKLAASICSAVISAHHGGLMDFINIEGTSPFGNRLTKDDNISFASECLCAIDNWILSEIDALIPKALDEIERANELIKNIYPKDMDNLLFTYGLFIRLLLSCLIDADRQDTYEFMSDTKLTESNMPWEQIYQKLLAATPDKEDTIINIARKQIAQSCDQAGLLPTGIYELTLPCGAGKTLSSLRFALRHNIENSNKKERIIYVLPFTTIIEQNAAIIKNIIKDHDVVLEHHSNLNEDSHYYISELAAENWHSQIIFTTMVQFMNTLFKSGTKTSRRMQALMNATIIFDEIQAIPIKCISMFNIALNFLKAFCNTTILLCTATQPTLSFTQRNLLISQPKSIIHNYEDYFKTLKRTQATDARIDGGYSVETLGEFVNEKYQTFQTVLVIVNTKKMAYSLFCKLQGMYEEKENAPSLFHLSTNMCPIHRGKVIHDIKNIKTNKICISTPLIEAGVDISFGCVIRSVCGLDSIVQAAGRCNREGEIDGAAPVYMVNPMDEKIDLLRDINIGKKTTEKILDDLKENPSLYDGDIFSMKSIETYFLYYFENREQELDYNISDYQTTLFDLLSVNKIGRDEYCLKNKEKFQHVFTQAFREANQQFSVIDENTRAVLVPYDEESCHIIKALSNMNDIANLPKLLRKAQRYSVNLYEREFKEIFQLGGFQLINAKLNLFAIAKDFYNDNFGVTRNKEMDNLVI